MAYDNIISRTDAAALIPEDVASEIMGRVTEESAAMRLMRHVTMSRDQRRMPVLAALPVAYFVNGDTGLKQTTEVNWANKFLDVEEIAAIVPIPEAVLDDASFDVWGEVRPLIEEAVGRTLDAAIFFGVNKPSIWPKSIATIAIDTDHVVNRGTHTAAEGGIAEDFNDLFSEVEDSGFDVNGVIGVRTLRGKLRGARDANGVKLDDTDQNHVLGEEVLYPMRGLWPTGSGAIEAIAGDWSQGILGLRQDLTYKILSEAVIQDAEGNIVYNLAQQDMVAMRVVSRFAYQVSNVVNFDQPDDEIRSPWAVMVAPA